MADMDIDQLLEAPYAPPQPSRKSGHPVEKMERNMTKKVAVRRIESVRKIGKDVRNTGLRNLLNAKVSVAETGHARAAGHHGHLVVRDIAQGLDLVTAAAYMRTSTVPATGAGILARGEGPETDVARETTRVIGMTSRGGVHRGGREASPILSDWERDKRTVFVAQLAARCSTEDLEDFFAAAGKVREAKIITDRNSRRSKGVGYVEFYEEESVKKALAMSGTKLLGIPIDVQLTESEKNRLAAEAAEAQRMKTQEMSYNRLYVGSLHFNITEEDLKAVFEPFGPIEFVNLHKDPDTGKSKGFAFVQYENAEDAKTALDKMNGFEIMGRHIRVGHITDKTAVTAAGGLTGYSLDENEAVGFALNSASRAELMAKLARDDMPGVGQKQATPVVMPTRCVLVKNMFDPAEETEPNWDKELEEDVKQECQSKYGTIVHIKVEKDSAGHVYMKYNDIPQATKAVEGLNGRFFGGKQASDCITGRFNQ
ncbi:hypothetical protein HDV00_009962 [Rhizophlyctis rosea]|nr:hypothetical protein HDV00_009962 [Rhizophlyctis rosea]